LLVDIVRRRYLVNGERAVRRPAQAQDIAAARTRPDTPLDVGSRMQFQYVLVCADVALEIDGVGLLVKRCVESACDSTYVDDMQAAARRPHDTRAARAQRGTRSSFS